MKGLSGRLGRKDYIIRMATIAVVSFILNLMAETMLGSHQAASHADFEMGAAIVVLGFALILTWATVCVTVQRLHDVGRSGWFALLLFLPFVGFCTIIWLSIAKTNPDLEKNSGPAAH